MPINYDGSFDIALGKSRKETNWKNRSWNWSALLTKISHTHYTAETYKEYISAKPARQSEIKDIGGFVGGYITQGRRNKGSIAHRQLITLDIDFGNEDTWYDFLLSYPVAAAIYTTHKHSPATPRYRLLIPLDRPVRVDEYEAISRRVAGTVGIELFDRTTFEPERLMYWPSTSSDGQFVYEFNDDPWLSADKVLSTYHDWHDSSEWPVSELHAHHVHRAMDKQGDPLEKRGIVGAFCRSYTISAAIETFLTEQYEPCDLENRYTYKEGKTSAGLIVYDDKFAFSHHGTDPTSGILCNAFDLVRIHKFGLLDEDGAGKASFTAMSEFARKDDTVKMRVGIDRLQEAKDDFSYDEEEEDNEDLVGEKPEDGEVEEEYEVEDTTWLKKMELDDKNKYVSTINNILIALNNDPLLKGKFGFNQFEQRETLHGRLPWHKKNDKRTFISDHDDAGLRHYIERVYGISNALKVKDALDLAVKANSYHPVKDYLSGLKWDGQSRIETLLVDYLGAEDTPYTRAVTRKALAAAVTRIFRPGVKFDYVLTLVGPEGVGKSQLLARLGRSWFSDSFSGVHGKESFEQLQGVWIVEIGELAGFKKADVEAVKLFVAKCSDRYRVAYGKRTEDFPRQCVFMGTTNEEEFLISMNGNRRFWPVKVRVTVPVFSIFDDLDEEEVNQIWAEAMTFFRDREKLCLNKVMEEAAFKIQSQHTIQDDRAGVIGKFLETRLPDDWEEKDIYERREFLHSEDPISIPGTKERTKVCIGEIWCECLGGQQKDLTRNNTKDLHDIMRKMPGWEMHHTKIRSKIYGIQRGYVKKLATS